MKKIIFAVITGAMFAAEIFMLKRYDVAPIGAGNTDVGFSTVNAWFHNLTGVNILWYTITDYLGYFAILVCFIFALAGLVQLIKRRSLFKVDREIICLGGLFIAVIGFYVLFEKVIINYRPIMMEGASEPEASFPSSHTMLLMTVMLAVMMITDKYVKNNVLAGFVRAMCVLITIAAVGGRLYCGVHWLTDIIGGVLLSTTLLLIFSVIKGDMSPDYTAPSGGRRLSTIGYVPKH